MPKRVQDWKSMIDISRKMRDRRIKSTQAYYDMYRDEFTEMSQMEEHHRVTVNMVFSNTITLLPLVYFKNPRISLIPLRPVRMISRDIGELPNYELMTRVVNQKIVEMKYYKTARLVVLDMSLCGTGISKVGWSRLFETDELRGEEVIVLDDLWIERVDPYKFLIDPLAIDEDAARWMGEEYLLPYNSVKKRFKGKKLEKLKPTFQFHIDAVDGVGKYSPVVGDFDEDLAVVRMYEIWDMEDRRVLQIAEGHEDDPFEDIPWPHKKMSGFPYEITRFHEDPNSPWGLSPVKPYEAQQHELNFLRSRIAINHAKNSRKYVVREGSFEPEEEDKLMRGEDGAVLKSKHNDPSRAVHVLQENVFNQDMHLLNAMIQNDINNISGVDDATRGQVTKGRTTATEIQRLTAGLQIRVDDKRSQVEKHIKYTWKKAVQVLIENMTGEQYVNYFDEQNERPVVVIYTNADVEGNYDVDVEVGSSQMPNREVQQRLLLELYSALIQNPNVNQRELARQLLKSFELESLGLLQEVVPGEIRQGQSGLQNQAVQGAQESQVGEPTQAALLREAGGQNRG